MKERPEVGAVVKTKAGECSPVYEGPVTKHDPDTYCFWQQVEKVDGEPKEEGTYPEPVVSHVNYLVD